MDAFLSLPTAHCHAPHPDRPPAIQLKKEIKTRAVMTDESSSSIINSALRTYPWSAVGELPRSDGLSLTIRRQRTTETVDVKGRLPEKLRKTYRDEDFILHEDKKLIIFTTKTNLSILKQNKHWFADGTFKVCPDNCYQLFTLHAMMTNAIIPLVYGLPIGKSNDDYNQFFEKLFEQDNFQPESIMTDFESGTGRKKPLFGHKLWNIHDRVIVATPRSNNSVEGWHNAFANRASISHPNIVKLTEKIRREQSKFEVNTAKILQGHIIKTKKACYRRLDERITRLVNAFDSSRLDEFLKKAC
ncbi:unnamed protein product [Rotaria magnacalcarata]